MMFVSSNFYIHTVRGAKSHHPTPTTPSPNKMEENNSHHRDILQLDNYFANKLMNG